MKRDAPAFPLPAMAGLFPALAQRVNGHRLVYLDGAASKLMPQPVIDAVHEYLGRDHANVHRGVHALSDRATGLFEDARESVRRFVNAASTQEIVFTRGATESLNLVARGLAEQLRPGDEIIVSALEHHANLVPWQMVCERTGAVLHHIPVLDDGTLDAAAFARLLSPRSKVLAITQLSNAIGTAVPVREFIATAKQAGLVTVVDGAQAVAHQPVDVRALGCDFYAFSAHKMYGPTGIGVLYGRFEALDALPPWLGGGDMIETVTLQRSTYAALPSRLEAGTPNIAGAVGLGAAVRWLESLDREAIARAEAALLANLHESLEQRPWLRIVGAGAPKVGAVSFVVDGVHAHDVGTVLDQFGVAVRVGHHCAMPVMQRFGVPATVRASLSLHNAPPDVDDLMAALQVAWERLRVNLLDDLYQELLLDHKRRPRNHGRLQCAHRAASGHNPLCGDTVCVQLAEGGGAISDIAFEGVGCAICIASASMMTEAVKGRPVAEAKRLSTAMRDLLTSAQPPDEAQEAALGKLAALQGVRRFPSRIKCAMLAWHALDRCLDDDAGEAGHAGVTA